MNRTAQLEQLRQCPRWDVLIIGGGATGLGAALDAAARGYKTLLVERADFGKGTSSRSTKLIHGGVRYLEQGNIKLVQGALRERWTLLRNAPELARPIPFILPVYSHWKRWYYWLGLKFYDLLSGRLSLGSTRMLSAGQVTQYMPSVQRRGLKGGVMYYDGQFDDSGLCIALANTAIQHGATVLNYMAAEGFLYENGRIAGATLCDQLAPNAQFIVQATVVINATGVFADALMQADHPGHQPVVRPSQGIHLVVDSEVFPGRHAMLIPRTTDGRVLFAVPWMGKVVIGTTDVQVEAAVEEPVAHTEEIDFIIQNFNQYCHVKLRREDVRAVFAGMRPLVRRQDVHNTAKLLRDHTIIVSHSGLVTIIGGKWTTYRQMAKDVVSKAAAQAQLPRRPCRTRHIPLRRPDKDPLLYAEYRQPLHLRYAYTEADVLQALRSEMAVQLEDVLARRIRLLFLDQQAALDAAPHVARVMQRELGHTEDWVREQITQFTALAGSYGVMDKAQAR